MHSDDTSVITRRRWLGIALGGTAAALMTGAVPAFAAAPVAITVYKDPSCGCCNKWVEHLRAHGFAVTTRDTADMDEVKDTFGVPAALRSCHTGTIGAYVIEGHVPADVIQQLVHERATVAGLAVPGMVTGSPGMEGGTPQPYDIIAYQRDGKTRVYGHR